MTGPRPEYLMVYSRTPGGFHGHFPDLPGVTAHGATEAELHEHARDAASAYVRDFSARGLDHPLPLAATRRIEDVEDLLPGEQGRWISA